MLFHGFSPDRRATRPAYSDDGCRRKQSSGKPGPKASVQDTMQAARQLFEA
jgi:hypothetical protein